MKTCSKCKLSKTIDEFSKNRKASDGLFSYCKTCAKAAYLKWSTENKDRKSDYQRRYHVANKSKRNEASRRYNRENPDKVRKWRTDNREYHTEFQRQLRKSNPLYYRLNDGAVKARKLECPVKKFNSADLLAYWQSVSIDPARCYYCNEELQDGWHTDHKVPLSRGGSHSTDNIVPSCPACNVGKSDRTADEYHGQLVVA